MPGKRSSARERARAAALGPERLQAIHAALVAELPAYDRALIGWPAILGYLAALHIVRPNGRALRRRMLLRWRVDYACPILPGSWRRGRVLTPPLSTAYALTAWILSRIRSGETRLFAVNNLAPRAREGKRRQEKSRQCPPARSRAA